MVVPVLFWLGILPLATGLRWDPLQPRKQSPSGAGPLDGYRPLGQGGCLGASGEPWPSASAAWSRSALRYDGSSRSCEQACSKSPTCSGYVSDKKKKRCSIIALSSAGFDPSDTDREPNYHCFLRHKFNHSSKEYTPSETPAIIWSFWNDPANGKIPVHPRDLFSWAKYRIENVFSKNLSQAMDAEPLVTLAVESWRKLNPEYEIRILDLDNYRHWLSPEDLPRMFERMEIAHKADAIRIGVIAKYGGVWSDATSLMLRPLREVLGDDRLHRAFVATYRGDLSRHGKRADWTHYVDSAFLTAPANDTLINQVKSCFSEAFSELDDTFTARPLEAMGLFSQEQLQEMAGVGIDGSSLTMHACFFKSLDEDASMRRFWDGPWLRLIEGSRGLFPHLYFWSETWLDRLFREQRPELARTLIDGDGAFLLKFREVDRRKVAKKGLEELRCGKSTFHEILSRLDLTSACPA